MRNPTLIAAAQKILKNLLAHCTEGQQTMFKRMYAHGRLETPINQVVEEMETEKMDWAITQTEATLKKESKLDLAIQETVYVITNPENGWDSLVAVISGGEEKVKEWFKTKKEMEVTNLQDHDQFLPYVIFKSKVE